MRRHGDSFILASTDLSNYLGCGHRSGLDLAVTRGARPGPDTRTSATLRALQERGQAHERAYLEHLRARGLEVVEIPDDVPPDVRVQLTRDTLYAGADVVYQGAFRQDQWFGYADILRKIPNPPGTTGHLGDWHYEPYDTKLAQDIRGGTILQLALYAELLASVQGVNTAYFHVVTPGEPFLSHAYRLADFAAYFRRIRNRFLEHLARGHDTIIREDYPEPVEHCDVCPWWIQCDARRRNDDHLSFIASVTRSQRTEFVERNVATLAQAAALPVPLTFNPTRGSREALERRVQQAQVQFDQRLQQRPIFYMLPIMAEEGLCRLPAPSPGDLFLDFEGARFARPGGHEYLTGVCQADPGGVLIYQATWAWTEEDEQQAFVAFIDRCIQTRARDAEFHVYHFGAYEPTTLKRLAGRYAVRQDALDLLLKEERFVNLHTIVRQSIRAGVESYSLKQLEQYCGFARTLPLEDANRHLHAVEAALEADAAATVHPESRQAVERYNDDDVRSTAALRDWLESLRNELIEDGHDVPRPIHRVAEVEVTERTATAEDLRQRLLAGLDAEAHARHHPGHPRWLLGYLVDWHHREERTAWWEYFRLARADEDELFDEPKAVAGLEHVEVVGQFRGKTGRPTGSVIHRYQFPFQDVEISDGKRLLDQDKKTVGTLVSLDRSQQTIDVKQGPSTKDVRPTTVFSVDVVSTETLQQSVMRFAERVLAAGDDTRPLAGLDLLYRRPPRLTAGTSDRHVDESPADFAIRVVTSLDRTVLSIQGPPGTGKTYVGARMIRAAVTAGQRVGVTATSHKVIQNLLTEVQQQAVPDNDGLSVGRKGEADDIPPRVTGFRTNPTALQALADGDIHVLGGTAWLWSDPDAEASLDTLFIDEAGQMSLATVLAVAPATRNVVLLGDPQQLHQPQKASHPDGVDVSALAHMIGDNAVIARHQGIFMTDTWRMAPSVCAFTSELFYRDQLRARAHLAGQVLRHTGGLDGAGLWWIPVDHAGNRNASEEEVAAAEAVIDRLTRTGATWIEGQRAPQPLRTGDIRVVAPYNAQVNRLAARLAPRGVEVGTVDKFQGQTCAAVIYSMASSSPDDAPRGMEFLYSLNRLNVATSRARCAVFVIASHRLLGPNCGTPHQMHLANGLCRYVEMARTVAQA